MKTYTIANLDEVKDILEGNKREVIDYKGEGLVLSEESLQTIASCINGDIAKEKQANNEKDFENEVYIQRLISKIENNNNGNIDVFSSREQINIILFDNSDEFVCKIDTTIESEINFEEEKGTIIKIKSGCGYGKLINNLFRNKKFSGKAILESTIRNTKGEDYLVRMFTSNIDLLKHKTINPTWENGISSYEMMFVIPTYAKTDYEVTKL
jgi:hypothetical protein